MKNESRIDLQLKKEANALRLRLTGARPESQPTEAYDRWLRELRGLATQTSPAGLPS